jgi:peptidyl-tRNA hydrolase ICT1
MVSFKTLMCGLHVIRASQRSFSNKVPKVVLPVESLEFSFSRASGPGGQNVNKVNTKAELRLHVMSASWIPDDVKQRFLAQEKNKINQDGTLVITSQEQRYIY